MTLRASFEEKWEFLATFWIKNGEKLQPSAREALRCEASSASNSDAKHRAPPKILSEVGTSALYNTCTCTVLYRTLQSYITRGCTVPILRYCTLLRSVVSVYCTVHSIKFMLSSTVLHFFSLYINRYVYAHSIKLVFSFRTNICKPLMATSLKRRWTPSRRTAATGWRMPSHRPRIQSFVS